MVVECGIEEDDVVEVVVVDGFGAVEDVEDVDVVVVVPGRVVVVVPGDVGGHGFGAHTPVPMFTPCFALQLCGVRSLHSAALDVGERWSPSSSSSSSPSSGMQQRISCNAGGELSHGLGRQDPAPRSMPPFFSHLSALIGSHVASWSSCWTQQRTALESCPDRSAASVVARTSNPSSAWTAIPLPRGSTPSNWLRPRARVRNVARPAPVSSVSIVPIRTPSTTISYGVDGVR